ncbi:hypothetical protein JRC49_01840 [Clostridiales bacterium FE2011]|nr:hypothetical protein JRC49_01840 [Clostridiales bacterium FE2011]
MNTISLPDQGSGKKMFLHTLFLLLQAAQQALSFLYAITRNEQFFSLFDQFPSNDADKLTSCACWVVLGFFFVYALCVVGNN